MYLPDHFNISDQDEIFSFLQANAFGQLISLQDKRITSSHLPFLIAAERKHLQCHLARQNPQWRQLEGQQVLITFQGPHDYVSPSWYQTAGVPTWNYQAVYRDAMLKAIIGVEIEIAEIQCKYKLSQNRSETDRRQVIDQLDKMGAESIARAMRKTLL
jgi:transcriptional regulator